jgi:hypothetical protein
MNVETADSTAALAALASAIVPADDRDAGAAAVNAGPRLAEKLAAGPVAALYQHGLQLAASFAARRYAKTVDVLTPHELHNLVADLRSEFPAFYKQLRMDVSAMYLSDPAVWQRIGFPGPSTASGGYPDFDQPQQDNAFTTESTEGTEKDC